jgi:glycerophosphoryl diester phosphodiesterase
MRRYSPLFALLLGGMTAPAVAADPKVAVIAHRGASGERPEHTLEAYALAIEQGADWIEPDLVITSDGVLVARHENEISETTDVGSRPEYAGRRTTKVIEGKSVVGWFAEDFTLAELKTLRARERLPQLRPASAAYDRQFQIATLDEIAALVRDRGGKAGRPVGIVAELKHAAYFDSIGLPLDRPLLAALDGSLGQDKARVIVESFEPGILRRLNRATEVRLVQLLAEEGAPADSPGLTFEAMATPEGLARIRGYADGIGAAKGLIIPRGSGGASLPPTTLVEDAKQAGLLVFAWTFRSENSFLPTELRRGEEPGARGDAAAEYRMFYKLGVDGVFSDFPAEAAAARGE